MIKSKLISVIVPVYNVEPYLSRCLNSIINNTYKNLEIICINDGSTDDSLSILRSYEKLDDRIKVISKDNGGLSSARNVGLENCIGDFITFIDSDDWIHKEYFSFLLSVQEKGDYDIVVGSYRRTMDSAAMDFVPMMVEIEEFDRVEYVSSHRTKNYVWGKIYRRECLRCHYFDENEKVEDSVYNMILAVNHPNLWVAYLDIPLYALVLEYK